MKISVFGTGYVGLVTGVCFAEMGNDVVGADIDARKVSMLQDGASPIYEPGLDSLLISNLKMKRIQFTTNIQKAVEASEILFIAVGTPSDEDGSADLQYVVQAAENIGKYMNSYRLVVNKSTVPVGTQRLVKEKIQNVLSARGVSFDFDVVSNPEFLREGCALEDCLKPNRVVIGCETERAKEILSRLYEPFLKSGNPLIAMDPLSSEMTKYAANSMLATKISLMNEISRVCTKVGADIEMVRRGIGTDFRIGPHFIYAGVGYGGSCFPKDVKALVKTGQQYGEEMQILTAVENTNHMQRQNFFKSIQHSLKNIPLSSATIGVWGVAFKPGTDDIREAPAMDLIAFLVQSGARVRVYDPVAAERAKEVLSSDQVRFFEDQYEVCDGVDVLAILTEWKSFREPNFELMKSKMRSPVICDGRNIYNLKVLKSVGFEYHSIGRPSVSF